MFMQMKVLNSGFKQQGLCNMKNIKTGVPSDTIALKIGIINLNKAININLNDIKLRYTLLMTAAPLYRLI